MRKKIIALGFCFLVCVSFAPNKKSNHPKPVLVPPVARPMTVRPILIVHPSLEVGGAERALIAMINHPDFPRDKVELCLMRRGGEFERFVPANVPIVNFNEAKLKKYKVVVAYLESGVGTWRFLAAERRIQWVHCDLKMRQDRGLPLPQFHLINDLDAVVCVSQAAKESFCSLYPSLAKKARVINNVVNKEIICQEAKSKVQDFVKAPQSITVVSCGRLVPVKAYDRVIAVARRLVDAGMRFQWCIIGDGMQRKELEQQIIQHNLQEVVYLLGLRTNPYPYIKKADIFALLSYREGFGLVVAEAKILGRPIIATDVGGIREQIVSGKNGLIVANDEQAIYEGLQRLISDAALRNKLSEALTGFEYDNREAMQQINELLVGSN